MPAFVRAYLPAEYQFARFEVLVGNYYQSLDSRRVYVDLHDSKSQYFLIIFGAGLGLNSFPLFFWVECPFSSFIISSNCFQIWFGLKCFYCSSFLSFFSVRHYSW